MVGEWNITLIIAIVGAVCGVSGAVLGIINTWHQLQKNKVKLKVRPQQAIPVGSLENYNINFSIEVTNFSEFPVTISDVGFQLSDGKKATLSTVNGMEQPSRLPIRLETHTAYTKYFNIADISSIAKKVISAYANTQCGEVITGKSPALKQVIKELEYGG